MNDYAASREKAVVSSVTATVPASERVDKAHALQTLEIEWPNVEFHTNSISVRLPNGHWTNNLPVRRCQKSFNHIKSIYGFRGAPKLRVVVEGPLLRRILNHEVLDYYLEFLDVAVDALVPHTGAVGRKRKFKGFKKEYFQKHLPHLFTNSCFQFLCKKSDDNLPIVPLPEVVKGTSGQQRIDDSFLFPIQYRGMLFIAWESVEESKATYLFHFHAQAFESSVQLIYDFLAGSSINKRSTLTANALLAKSLGKIAKVRHSTFDQWRCELPF